MNPQLNSRSLERPARMAGTVGTEKKAVEALLNLRTIEK